VYSLKYIHWVIFWLILMIVTGIIMYKMNKREENN
jgi:hypothetical protein